MASVAFTKNYTDHSNPNGFQFEFHCDKCGNGFRSSYQANQAGMASSVLDAASSLFGGGMWGVARAGDQLKDMLRGKAWDNAFQAAIAEIKPKFRQCRRCGRWVCPEICWNEAAAECKECAPALQEEAAAARAQGARDQVFAKAGQADLAPGVDLTRPQAGACPHCNAAVAGGKFCPSCGKPLSVSSDCSKCGKPVPASAKFCPECGAPRA